MAQTIKLKRSAVAGRIPSTSDLDLGEMAINTVDGKLYIKKNIAGEESIVEIGSLDDVDSINFSAVAEQGELSWDEDKSTLVLSMGNGVVQQIGEELYYPKNTKNNTAAVIPNGTPVMLVGGVGEDSYIAPAIADGSIPHEYYAGLTTEEIGVGEYGRVLFFGSVNDVDTSSFNKGDILYVSDVTPGGFTTDKPESPSHAIQAGLVTKVGTTDGRLFVRVATNPEASEITYDNTTSGLVASNVKGALDELQQNKASVDLLSSNIVLFPTTASSDVTNHNRLVISKSDTDYNTTAVDIATGSIGSTETLVGQLISDAGLVEGSIAGITVTLLGNIEKTAGNSNQGAHFYFKMVRREADGTEHEMGESFHTSTIFETDGYEQFSSSVYLSDSGISTFSLTDRIVLRFYGIAESGSPEYNFQFGGSSPIRSIVPVPISVIPSTAADQTPVDTSSFNGILDNTATNVQAALDTIDDHDHATEYAPLTGANYNNWDTAYGWGNHALVGYITGYSETDTLQTVTDRGAVTTNQLEINTAGTQQLVLGTTNSSFDGAGNIEFRKQDDTLTGRVSMSYSSTMKFLELYTNFLTEASEVRKLRLYTGGDLKLTKGSAEYKIWDASDFSSTKVSNWDTAYGWGDHSQVGYLTTYEETDPVFSASDAANITATGISNWNTAYGWGDHSSVGYLTSETNDYLDSATFSGGTLTLGRTGSLSDVTVSLDGRYSQTDTNTTYSVSAADVASGKAIRLTGSDAVTDDVILAGGNNVSLTRSGDTITINSADAAAETITTLTKVGNNLRYVNEAGTTATIDLTSYLDDTNLSKIVSGTMSSSGIATFSRDDSSTFTVDMSVLLDDTNLARIVSAGWNTGNGVLTLTRNDGSTIPVDLDNRYLQSYAETDTLASVTARGNSTSSNITISKSNTGAGYSSYADMMIEDVDAHLDITSTNGGTWGSAINLREGSTSSFVNSWSIARTTGASPDLRFNFGTGNDHNVAGTKVRFTSSGQVHASSFHGSIDYSNITNPPPIDNSVDYINAASFNTSSGVLTLSGVGRAGATVDLDGRYYNTSDSDSRYVNVTGDTMTGALTLSGATDLNFLAGSNEDAGDIVWKYHNGTEKHRLWDGGTGLNYRYNGGTSYKVFHDGYHPNADKWTTARTNTVALSGDVTGTGSASVDGTGNWTVNVSTAVANDSHNHTYFDVSNITDLNSVPSVSDTRFRPFVSNFQAANRSGSNYNGGFEVGLRATGYRAQLVFEADINSGPKFRIRNSTGFGSWKSIWHSGNFNPSDYLQVSNYVDTDNYVDSVGFNTSNGILTIGRTGSLADLTVDLDGRYLTSETDNQTLSWNGSTGQLSISNGNTVDLDGRYTHSDYINTGTDWNTYNYGSNESFIARVESSASNPPATGVYNWSLIQQGDSVRGSQVALSAFAGGNRMYFRGSNGGNGWNGWDRVFADNYHPNADKWTTARTNTVTLTGDVTGSGSASVDGSGNWTVSVPAVVANDSHTHSNYLSRVSTDHYTPKRLDMGSSTSWDSVGFGSMTSLHFQDHNQFWVGAGNGTWFKGTANTKDLTGGLSADASVAHDLLITTMQGTSTYDRGITFAVDSGGSGSGGWRLGKWHSSTGHTGSMLAVDGQIRAKGGYTDEADYYADDYSQYHATGVSNWSGDTNAGWHKPSIVASTAIQIQSGTNGTNTRKPQIQFHQYGYGGMGLEYDGPSKVLTIGELNSATQDRFNHLKIKTNDGVLSIGPMNTGHCHIETDRSNFYFNKEVVVDGGIIGSYNEDLYLRRARSSADQIHISTTTTTISQDTVIQGNLTVNGSISQGDDFGKLYTYNVTMGLSTSWADVSGIALPTGTYAIQIKVYNHDAGGGNYDEHYSGTMAWYGGGTNDGDSNEIPLHNAGHAYNGHAIYARTLRRLSSSMVLQLAASGTISADGIEIKIRKLI